MPKLHGNILPEPKDLAALRERAKRYDPRAIGFDLRWRVLRDFLLFLDEQGLTFAGVEDLVDPYYVAELYLAEIAEGLR
jgi:hypothetical protein